MRPTPRLRGALLEAIAPGPPDHAGEVWFNADLERRPLEELLDEARRLRLRLLLTPVREQADWPARWIAERLARVEALLCARGAPAGPRPPGGRRP